MSLIDHSGLLRRFKDLTNDMRVFLSLLLGHIRDVPASPGNTADAARKTSAAAPEPRLPRPEHRLPQ